MTTYTTCPTFDEYVQLWLQFSGDQDLLEEMIEHKAGCPVCIANMEAANGISIQN